MPAERSALVLTGCPLLHQDPGCDHHGPERRVAFQPVLRLVCRKRSHMAFSQPFGYCFAVILSHRLCRFDQVNLAGDP